MGALARRSLALLILLGLIGLVVAAAAWPMHAAYKSYAQAADELRVQIERLQRVNAEKPGLQVRLEGLRSGTSLAEELLTGASSALAAAGLQSRIKELARQSGAGLSTTQVLPSAREETLERVSLRLEMNGDIGALQRFLTLVEADKPVIFVDTLVVRVANKGSKAAQDRFSVVPLQWSASLYAYRGAYRGER